MSVTSELPFVEPTERLIVDIYITSDVPCNIEALRKNQLKVIMRAFNITFGNNANLADLKATLTTNGLVGRLQHSNRLPPYV
jgi:hypothetical protein